MTFNITQDSLSNQLIGRLEFGNHSINSPNLNYLKSDLNLETTALQTELLNTLELACENSNISYTLNGNFSSGNYEINWSSNDDLSRPPSGRFRLGVTSSRNIIMQVRDDNNNLVVGNNSITAFDLKLQDYSNSDETFRPALYFAISDKRICFGAQVVDSSNTANILSFFVYGGYLSDVNTNFNYYSENIINSCFVMAKSSNNIFNGYHYIKNQNKQILTTGDVNYPIACADSNLVPTVDWTTGLYVFDNDEVLGFPAIGRVSDFIASTSQTAFDIGVPAALAPTANKPDLGNNRWLPIGTWLGKTIFTRIA